MIVVVLFSILVGACNHHANKDDIFLPYLIEDFEKEIDGKKARLRILENENGMLLVLSDYGARIISLYTPDRNGKLEDVVLGCPSLDEYINGNPGVGAIIGPVANRISGAKFEIDGIEYDLPHNKGDICQHSGNNSFYRQVWKSDEILIDSGKCVLLSLFSPDGEWGFPGNKHVTVRYTLTNENALFIDYSTATDKSCFINLTNHAYFNLGGPDSEDILDHIIQINADYFTPFGDENLVPSGEIAGIKGTDLDFTSPHRIGERINSSYIQMQMAGGYDQNFVLNKDGEQDALTFCSKVRDPVSGRLMDCYTTEPGLQFYTANFLDGSMKGNGRKALTRRSGLCLETQHFPDSQHHDHFPNTLLLPGDTLKSRTVYRFSVDSE